ncbi:uncharacterized protein KY384_005566 [Bacidia gigantensis]|uniref:uncharacterized protein n=1 Tax=Bacidia gigantensis TaxID=2732470 RepID=UPI001D04F8B9|nr:uncharacterized protein KY384_005566 [Bacidia gigantensis]KAG8530084.1 hypothetical protein KY384_005566 [Bacidia gigantensis]
MATARQTIALAGVGNLGRYICEEFVASPDFDVVVLSRDAAGKPWMKNLDLTVSQTDYTAASLTKILNDSKASILVSVINLIDPSYVTVHAELLSACRQSVACKHLIPSEFAGDCEKYPLRPGYYVNTREPFRQMLREQRDVKWTLVNMGYIMDYLLPQSKTHMLPLVPEFPIDAEKWHATLRGTGDEVQSMTRARDTGRAVVELCKAKEWEPYTFISGEWTTFNQAIKELESYYGTAFSLVSTSYPLMHAITQVLSKADEGFTFEIALAQVEEMIVEESFTFPKEKTLAQREKYLGGMKFMSFRDLLKYAETVDKV